MLTEQQTQRNDLQSARFATLATDPDLPEDFETLTDLDRYAAVLIGSIPEEFYAVHKEQHHGP